MSLGKNARKLSIFQDIFQRIFGRNSSVPNWNCKFCVQYVLWIWSQSAYPCINANKYRSLEKDDDDVGSATISLFGIRFDQHEEAILKLLRWVLNWLKGMFEEVIATTFACISTPSGTTIIYSWIGKWGHNWGWEGHSSANQLFSARLGHTNCIEDWLTVVEGVPDVVNVIPRFNSPLV